jgi:hypothetical protein
MDRHYLRSVTKVYKEKSRNKNMVGWIIGGIGGFSKPIPHSQ